MLRSLLRSICSLFPTLLLCATVAFGQNAANKLDPLLKMVLGAKHRAPEEGGAGKATVPYIQVLIKGDPLVLQDAIAAVEGHVGTIVGDILTARIPFVAVRSIIEHPAVERIEVEPPLAYANDTAIEHVRAHLVGAGSPPLERRYTGKGVVVGIVDTGIDFTHPDFRDPSDASRSRILAIWDQTDPTGPPPTGYTYGTEWTRAQIEAALRGEKAVTQTDTEGHGTHVAGTAAGNGAAVGRYQGVAPEADLIMVKLGPEEEEIFGELEIPSAYDYMGAVNSIFRTSVVDGANYIYTQAEEQGQPAVVNLSLGTDFGPHDGSTLLEQALDGLVQTPGRALCVAAGNEGANFQHWGAFELETDSLWTYFYMDVDQLVKTRLERLVAGEDYPDGLQIDIMLYGTVATDEPASTHIAMGFNGLQATAFSFTPLEYEGQTPWHSLAALAQIESSVQDSLYYNSGELAGIVDWAAQNLEGGKVGFAAFIRDETERIDWAPLTISGSELYRFMVRGSGEIHLWAESGWTGARAELRLDVTESRYRLADWDYSVTIPGNARSAITVGAYANKPDGVLLPAGTLANFSSTGPTVDGRLKPEITAPGHNVFSARSADALKLLKILELQGLQDAVLAPEGRHWLFSGTSMSTPVVSGAVALYLERDPNATNAQIRRALFDHAMADRFTDESQYFGPLPNHFWGYGKLDIFAAMTASPATYVSMEQAPDALPTALLLYQNRPNPFNPQTTIGFDLAGEETIHLALYNLSGQLIRTLVDQAHPAGRYEVEWDGTDSRGGNVASGMYLYRLRAGRRVETRKLLLLQ